MDAEERKKKWTKPKKVLVPVGLGTQNGRIMQEATIRLRITKKVGEAL
jgi:hypothetical protein